MTNVPTEVPPPPDAPAAATGLAALIDKAIERFARQWQPGRLPAATEFAGQLERAYETQTRARRVRELRFTVSAAAFFMTVLDIADPLFFPDLGWNCVWVRIIGAACMVWAVASFERLSAVARERAVCAALYLATLAMIVPTLLSHAPLAPFTYFTPILGFLYCNLTFPLRFRQAWKYNLLMVATILLVLHADPHISPALAWALALYAALGSSFSLITNYRMEQGTRLAYLLDLKESLRLAAVTVERERFLALSNTDGMTGLANRGHFDRRLADLFDVSNPTGKAVGLLLLDVDFFKRFNDAYGHPAGDACLRSVAAALTQTSRSNDDLAFRYGGEEFGALLVGVTAAQAQQIAERVRGTVERAATAHANRGDGLRVVTASVGVAHAVVGDGTTPVSLVERVDAALYAAKHGGRNRVSFAA